MFTQNKIYLVEEINYFSIINFNNFIIASPPRHRFWNLVIDQLEKNFKNRWVFRCSYILFSAGPGILHQVYNRYIPKKDIYILPKEKFNPCDICGNCNLSNSYIVHYGHAAWTIGMESYYMYFYCKRKVIGVIICIIVCIIFLLIIIKCATL